MEIVALLWIFSLAFTGLTEGDGVLPDGPLNAAVGGKVMFTTTLTPGTSFQSVTWKFGTKQIFTFNVNNFPAPGYEGRITFFMSTGSLELRNLALNDSGEYSVSITTAGEPSKSGNTRLEVYEPVSNVMVTASSTELVEFNSSVSLSCSSSGSSLSFLWLNSSSEGPFSCRVSNPVSEGTSDPVTLIIYYGPENTILKRSTTKEDHLEGSDILLSCSADSNPPAQYRWFLNGSVLSEGPELKLLNVQKNQSGSYSCQAFNDKTLRYEMSQPASISVLARVTDVVVTSKPTELVEFSSSVSLSCSSSGSPLSFLWLNSSSEVTESDRVQITDGGSTLTIVNVTRYDQGPFSCQVFNPVSNGTSDPLNLTIYYGPEKVKLVISLPQKYYEKGSDISLSCSADSRPSAGFQWFLNGDLLSDTGPELSLINMQTNQSGNYSCQAFNNKTLRYETSQSSVVSVLEKISGASVTSPTNLPIEGNSFTLICDAAGSVFTRKWKKGGVDLTLTVDMTLTNNSRELSFSSLNKNHHGDYSCIISNPLSSEEAKYSMIVNYGPETVQITGPSQIHVGGTFELTCSASSVPPASYTWRLNGTVIHTSAGIYNNYTELNDSGSYSCEAMNKITERISSAVHELTVTLTEQRPDPSGCSGGCIAGIVIGVLVVIGAAGGGGYYVYYKTQQKKKTAAGNINTRTGAQGQENGAFTRSQEMHYADVRFNPNHNGGAVQLGQQNNISNYAEVRVNNNPSAASSLPTYDAHLQRNKRPAPQPDTSELYAQVRKK
ncbi:hypothetical protein PBY51_017295 [Eleginops maclovinus]|uniref:Ig-like domain-containing protein n=1 Tax=Eleginops maclovinus TaxID=56733 RepID=A0AAN8AGH5_ELEMC|nr:hypothetical protein PBY51_017295 [Eleginops maclovinus]